MKEKMRRKRVFSFKLECKIYFAFFAFRFTDDIINNISDEDLNVWDRTLMTLMLMIDADFFQSDITMISIKFRSLSKFHLQTVRF